MEGFVSGHACRRAINADARVAREGHEFTRAITARKKPPLQPLGMASSRSESREAARE